jgi:hypothetical protein
MTPEEIVNRMFEKYAKCFSYKDSGFVENFMEGEERSQDNYLKFRTWYKHPYYFRFEWIDREYADLPWREHMVGCDGFTAFSKHQDGELIVQSTLKYAIAEASAPSRNAVTQISQHLPELDLLPVPWLSRHKDLTLIGKESANDKECYCIASTVKNPHDKIIWIACEDFSLRRVKTYTKVSNAIANEVLDMAKKLALKEVDPAAISSDNKPDKRSYIETNYEEVTFDREMPDETFAQPQE